jgi:hypothetical protein
MIRLWEFGPNCDMPLVALANSLVSCSRVCRRARTGSPRTRGCGNLWRAQVGHRLDDDQQMRTI